MDRLSKLFRCHLSKWPLGSFGCRLRAEGLGGTRVRSVAKIGERKNLGESDCYADVRGFRSRESLPRSLFSRERTERHQKNGLSLLIRVCQVFLVSPRILCSSSTPKGEMKMIHDHPFASTLASCPRDCSWTQERHETCTPSGVPTLVFLAA